MPNIAENSIKDVDYGTFMTMTEACKVSEVEVQDNQIVFTDKGNVIYRTGLMNDPDLTERLYESGATFNNQIVQETSLLLSFFTNWILPMLIFSAYISWLLL